ncbi:hypothetical protein COY95_00860, partial [Candidatus Woesearchaeota archaeon CG_4_10_14_0_8_um_filter_47_5]
MRKDFFCRCIIHRIFLIIIILGTFSLLGDLTLSANVYVAGYDHLNNPVCRQTTFIPGTAGVQVTTGSCQFSVQCNVTGDYWGATWCDLHLPENAECQTPSSTNIYYCDPDGTNTAPCVHGSACANWVAEGESVAFGGYGDSLYCDAGCNPATSSCTECCGDDSNENARPCLSGYGIACDGTSACCNSDKNAVYGGVCYGDDVIFRTLKRGIPFLDGKDSNSVIIAAGQWFDCDKMDKDCGTCDGVDVWGGGLANPEGIDLPGCTGMGCYIPSGQSGSFGEYTSSGQQGCCGDDSGELVETCELADGGSGIYWSGDCTSSDAACCSQAKCVHPTSKSCISLNTCNGGVYPGLYDEDAWCNANGKWKDLDLVGDRDGYTRQQKCEACSGNAWIFSGAAGVGEYANQGDYGCCGDDNQEEVTSFKTYLTGCNDITDPACVGANSDPSVKACCYGSCVKPVYVSGFPAHQCYQHNQLADIDLDGIAGEQCMVGSWYDCDWDEWHCTHCSGSFRWAQGGEWMQFGEYNSGTATECCNDDAGEHYIDLGDYVGQGIGDVGSPRCCMNDGPYVCVDGTGMCRYEYPTETSCGDGIDNDCDGTTDCEFPVDPDCASSCNECFGKSICTLCEQPGQKRCDGNGNCVDPDDDSPEAWLVCETTSANCFSGTHSYILGFGFESGTTAFC